MASQIRSVFSSSSPPPTPDLPPPLEVLVSEIFTVASSSSRGRVFVHGVGREGLMLKALCMRLFHLGIPAHVVGDVTTPPISPGDLLLASAGPSAFATVDAICAVAERGLGITLFGMAYMFVHDGLVHRRFPVGPIADVPYFRRVAAAHQIHHMDKFKGVPYGLFLGPKELEKVGGLEELEEGINRRIKRN